MKKKTIGIIVGIIVVIIIIAGVSIYFVKQNEAKIAAQKAQILQEKQQAQKEANQLKQEKQEQSKIEAEQKKEQVEIKKTNNKVQNQENQQNNMPYTPSPAAIALGNEIQGEISDLDGDFGQYYAQTGSLVTTGEESQDIGMTSQYFHKWDNLLNEMWKQLPGVLPKSTMESLTSAQIQWVKTRNSTALNSLQGGNQDLAYQMEARGDLTKERIQQIVNEYLK